MVQGTWHQDGRAERALLWLLHTALVSLEDVLGGVEGGGKNKVMTV